VSKIFIFFTIIFQNLSIVLLKYGSLHLQEYGFSNILKNYFYFGSIFVLLINSFFWQFVLKRYNLSFAYIFTSFSYLFTLIFGYYLFHESIKVNNIVGVVIIIFGIGITLMKEKKDDC